MGEIKVGGVHGQTRGEKKTFKTNSRKMGKLKKPVTLNLDRTRWKGAATLHYGRTHLIEEKQVEGKGKQGKKKNWIGAPGVICEFARLLSSTMPLGRKDIRINPGCTPKGGYIQGALPRGRGEKGPT